MLHATEVPPVPEDAMSTVPVLEVVVEAPVPETAVVLAPATRVMAVSPEAVTAALEVATAADVPVDDSCSRLDFTPPQASASCDSEPLPGPTGRLSHPSVLDFRPHVTYY